MQGVFFRSTLLSFVSCCQRLYFIGVLIVHRADKKEKECRDIVKLAAMVTISIMVVFFINYPLMSFLFQKVFK